MSKSQIAACAMPIQLTSEQTQFVQAQIATGRYATIEEVLVAAFRSLAVQEADAMDELTRAEDLQRIQNYRDTGKGIPHDQVAAWLSSIGTDRELPCPNGN
jgi:putative addiction module CopG family antidote